MTIEHTTKHTLAHGGRERRFRLHRSQGEFAGSRPLIIALHGGRQSAASMEHLSGLSSLSDREGFSVVYPEGVGRTWNDGRELMKFPSMREGVDDIGFIESLVDHLVADFDVDPARVYATGISNGGHMSHRLGVDLPHRIAAIAPVAASMPSPVQERAGPMQRVGVIMFFGDADRLNYWDGGGFAGGTSASVPDIMRWWARRNGCGPEPAVQHLPAEFDDGTRIRRETWSGSAHEVVLYAIEGGGHAWPNRPPTKPGGGLLDAAKHKALATMLGRTTKNLDANQTMWVHFQRHSL